MTITKSLGVVVVGVGLAASVLLLGQTWADSDSSPAPTPAPASTGAGSEPVGAIPLQAADLAGLVQLCIASHDSAEADAFYRQVSAAHPEESARIGPDCTIPAPRVGQP